MAQAPPVGEVVFLRIIENHGKVHREFSDLLLTADLPRLRAYVEHVAGAWFNLGRQHLVEAKATLAAGLQRATYSRAYYAAYNTSKAVRYLIKGSVSLKGEDHRKVSELPDDFPDVARWAGDLTVLYEHRLRADYDNWASTESEHTLSVHDAVKIASDFITACNVYLSSKHGTRL